MPNAREHPRRLRLIAAVRDRMQHRSDADAAPPPAPVATPAPPRPARPAPPDHELEQIAAEAKYHRDRYELHNARVVSGSPAATTLGRLRELERAATAAEDRLATARRTASRSA